MDMVGWSRSYFGCTPCVRIRRPQELVVGAIINLLDGSSLPTHPRVRANPGSRRRKPASAAFPRTLIRLDRPPKSVPRSAVFGAIEVGPGEAWRSKPDLVTVP